MSLELLIRASWGKGWRAQVMLFGAVWCLCLFGCSALERGVAEQQAEGGSEAGEGAAEGGSLETARGTIALDAAIADFDVTRKFGGEPAGTSVDPGAGRCKPGMSLIGGRFCIDRWEGSLREGSGRAFSPYSSLGAKRLLASSEPGVVPQAHISFTQAKAACALADKALCTTAQWVEACAGSAKRPLRSYPYGNIKQRDACNVDQPGHPTLLLHAGQRKSDSYWLNDARINQIGATLAPTGAFPECVTPESVYDMVGNLLEWTDGERPLLMGGYYLDSVQNGEGCKYVTLLHGEDYHDFTTGFRCCSRAEPKQVVSPSASPGAAAGAEAAEPGDVPAEPGRAGQALASSAPPESAAAPPSPRDPAGLRSFEHAGAKLPSMGPKAEYAEGGYCPVDMVLVEGQRCSSPAQRCKYWVDEKGMPARSCGEFEPSVCEGAKTAMRFCIDRYEFTPPGYTYPLVHVSWTEAESLCRRHQKRLCYEREWEFACEGEEALPYPYGYTRDGSLCNHDLPGLFDARGKLFDQRVVGTSLPKCESPFGVYNLVGNVDEWTTSSGGGRRSVLRGGWWLKGRNRCRAATTSHGETYAGSQTGFRCCKAALDAAALAP